MPSTSGQQKADDLVRPVGDLDGSIRDGHRITRVLEQVAPNRFADRPSKLQAPPAAPAVRLVEA